MSDEDTTTAETATETVEPAATPDPTETVEFWKLKAREQEKRAKVKRRRTAPLKHIALKSDSHLAQANSRRDGGEESTVKSP